jgi:co-chaperonin GroES (HSP10)
MHSPFLQTVRVEDASQVKPTGDFVLIKPLPNDDPLSRLWLPASVHRKKMILKRGLVIAVGQGDSIVQLKCTECGKERARLAVLIPDRTADSRLPIKTGTCKCGCSMVEVLGTSRAAMNVQAGDEILYWRSPANDVRINEEEYVFLHEEQHIVGVIEKEEANVSTMVA